MTRAVLLCAGYGTRLSPLTDELPKPLVPLGDRPLFAHMVTRLRHSGVERLAINVHHLAEEFTRYIEALDSDIQISLEAELLGTAGGVKRCLGRLGGGLAPVLVVNGDLFAEPPVAELLNRARDGRQWLAVCPKATGSVGVDDAGNVVRLRGRSFGHEVWSGEFTGASALGERSLTRLPERGCLIGDLAVPELERGGTVGVVTFSAPWTDAGTIESYFELNLKWLVERGLSHFIVAGAWVEPKVKLVSSIVGAGARVTGSGALERCVVWPGAHAVAPLQSAIVTPRGRVVQLARKSPNPS